MKARIACLISVMILMIGFLPIITAQSTPYIVYGDVTNNVDVPVAGASIIIKVGGVQKATGTTDSNGHYQIGTPDVTDGATIQVIATSGSLTGTTSKSAAVSDDDPASLSVNVQVRASGDGGDGGNGGTKPRPEPEPEPEPAAGEPEPQGLSTSSILILVLVGLVVVTIMMLPKSKKTTKRRR